MPSEVSLYPLPLFFSLDRLHTDCRGLYEAFNAFVGVTIWCKKAKKTEDVARIALPYWWSSYPFR
jgi:hypothetical protein